MAASGTVESVRAHDAFISYSRKDGAFARRLEQTLESYRPPKDLPVPQRQLDIFRDEEDFTGTEYSRAVDLHLAQSKKLLLLCSPNSCASRYVDDEIRRFLRNHSAEDVIPLLLSGIPNNEATSANDPNCAFPPALTEALEIPLAADFRGVDATRSRLDRGASAGAWYSVLANMYDHSRAVIEQREVRRQTRRRRITAGIVGGIIAALSVALAVTIVSRNEAAFQRDKARDSAKAEKEARLSETRALHQAEASRDEALRQRAAAEREAIAARRETAERLSVQTVEKLSGSPEQALRLGIDAIETFHGKQDPLVPAAIGALQKATLSFGFGMPMLPHSDAQSELALSDDLRWAAQSDSRGNVLCGLAGSTAPVVLRAPPLPRGARWSQEETGLAFSGDRLIAIRTFKVAKDDEGLMVWYWRLDAKGAARETVVLDTYMDALSRRQPVPSPDGRWLAWTDGWEKLRVRALAPHAKTLKTICNTCRFAFSGDSQQMLVLSGTEVSRFDLSGDISSEPQELTSLKWDLHDGDGAAIAVYAGDGPVGRDAEGEVKWGDVSRVAVLAAQGIVHWWNLTEAEPVLHSTASMLEPYREKLKLDNVVQDHVDAGLVWNAAGSAVITTVKRDDQAFGLAAVSVLLDDPKWRPLWHRYDGKATERTSETSNSSNNNYEVIDSGDLGVEQAIWYSTDAFVTLGFDGSVWWRDLERLDRNHFQLVARDASAIATLGKMVVVGGRDGAVRFKEETVIAHLNAHDAPVKSIRINPWSMRMVSLDARGGARGWDLEHPAIAEWLSTTEGASTTMGDDARTLITVWLGGRVELRDAQSPDSLAPARVIAGLDTRKSSVAVDPAGRWIGAMDLESGADLPLRLRLWRVDGLATADVAPLVHRFSLPRDMTGKKPQLSLYSSASRLIAQFRSTVAGSKDDDAGWVMDSRDQFAQLHRLGSRGARQTIRSVDVGLRWLMTTSGGYAEPPKRYFLIDLESAQGFGASLPLPATMNGDYIEFDPAAQWLRVGIDKYDRCLIDLSAPRKRCIPIPRAASDVLFGRERAPLVSGYQADVFVLEPGTNRFRKINALKGSRLGWDASGRWLAAWSPAEGVRLFPVTGQVLEEDAAAVRLPDAPTDVGEINALFPYVEQRWLFAATDGDHIVCWYRDDEGRWLAPVILMHQELRTDSWDTTLREDGKTLVVGLQAISLDPDRLLAQARQLLGGGDSSAKRRTTSR